MHSSKKDPVILYFIAGSMPNSNEMSNIFTLGSNVRVRNGVIAEHTAPGAVESCDGVCGYPIPDAYKHKPNGEEVLHEMRKRIIDELRASEKPQEQEPAQSESVVAAAAVLAAAAEPKAEGKQPKADPKAATAWVAQK